MTPVSICTIIKNEEAHLPEFLSAVAAKLGGYPHELVIADTGSADGSLSLIREFAAAHSGYAFRDLIGTPGVFGPGSDPRSTSASSASPAASGASADTRNLPPCSMTLLSFDWTGDFSAAKNRVIRAARYDHVLVLDADEYLTEFDTSCIDRMIRQAPGGIGMIRRINRTVSGGMENTTSEEIPRFFDRRCFHYEGVIHEQLAAGSSLHTGTNAPYYPEAPHTAARSFGTSYASQERSGASGTNAPRNPEVRIALPVTIDHAGYIGTPEELRAKADRNNALLFKMLEENPEDPYLYYQIGQSYSIIKDYENAYLYYGKGLGFEVDERLSYVHDMVIGYGYAMLETGRFEEALGFEGIYESFKESADFLCLMGLIYMRNGMIDRSYREFENAVSPGKTCSVAGSDSYLSLYNMAVIDEAMGNTEKALSLYKRCGDFPPAMARLTAASR